MADSFLYGYALLIGVTENTVTKLNLPMVSKDVDALNRVLTHPERCAYACENVHTLIGKCASRTGILQELI